MFASLKKTAVAVAVAGAALSANAAIVTIKFDAINQQATYSEAGFNFAVTNGGNHTDDNTTMWFHDFGNNPGDTDLLMTFGGNAFSILSYTLLTAFDPSSIVSSAGTFSIAQNAAPGDYTIGLTNITSATFKTEGGFGLMFDNLVVDTAPRVSAVPEPGSLALLGLGLAGLAAIRKRKQA